MATQAVIIHHKRRKKKKKRPLFGRLAGGVERAKSSVSDPATTPSWYPFDSFDGPIPSDTLAKIIKVQATFRGFKARKYARKVYRTTVTINAAALVDLTREIRKLHFGWKRFLHHLLLLLLVSVVVYLQLLSNEPNGHELEAAALAAFNTIQYGDNGNDFESVRGTRDMYAFIEAAVAHLYRKDPYEPLCEAIPDCEAFSKVETESTLCPVTEFGGILDPFNRIQVGMLITQERTEPTLCNPDLYDLYTDTNFQIYEPDFADYKCTNKEKQTEYKSAFLEKNPTALNNSKQTIQNAFQYSKDINAFYSILDLGLLNLNEEVRLCEFRKLKELEWIDSLSERVCLVLVLQNQNGLGRYAVALLCFRTSLGGSVEPEILIRSGSVLTYKEDTAAHVMTGIYMLVVIGNLVHYAVRLVKTCYCDPKDKATRLKKATGIKHYIFEGFVLLFHLTCCIWYFIIVSKVHAFEPFDSISDTELVQGLSAINDLIYLQGQLRTTYSVLLFFMTIRSIVQLDFHDDTAIISRTIRGAAGDLISFCFVFVLVVFSFAFIGVILFSSDGFGFSTFPRAVVTLLFVSMGEFERATDIIYNENINNNSTLGQIFLWSYIFLISLVLFNILLSIIVESFVSFQEKKNSKKRIGFIESFRLFFHVALYDIRYFYWPMFCCQKSLDPHVHDLKEQEIEKDETVDPTVSSSSSHHFHHQSTFIFFKTSQDSKAVSELESKPHKFLYRLEFLRENSQAFIPTFVVRKQFESLFGSSKLVEKMLCLLRERTGNLRSSAGREERDILFKEDEAQLYTIDLVHQVLRILRADERFNQTTGPHRRRTLSAQFPSSFGRIPLESLTASAAVDQTSLSAPSTPKPSSSETNDEKYE